MSDVSAVISILLQLSAEWLRFEPDQSTLHTSDPSAQRRTPPRPRKRPIQRGSPVLSQADRLIHAARRLAEQVDPLHFAAPVTHVYNPLVHAHRPHRRYLRRFGDGRKRILFLGMNPGPYGMTQTGVPFGEVAVVRDWLGIHESVSAPRQEHPKRPVEGFDCRRSEVSGARLWGAIADHWKRPEAFFAEHFVTNYCPLVFMEESGRNRTPDKLPTSEREPLYQACDQHLRKVVEILEPEWVIGIGAFAEKRARETLAAEPLRFGRVLHPSPASPLANKDWAGAARKDYQALGLCGKKRSPPRTGPAS
jgi:single-strand selective monofunctional uracil DNA glycosylase